MSLEVEMTTSCLSGETDSSAARAPVPAAGPVIRHAARKQRPLRQHRSVRRFRNVLLALVLGRVALPGAAEASETVIPITPPGSTDVDQATLPPVPGLYGGTFLLPFSFNTKLYNSAGQPVPAFRNLKVSLVIGGPALVYVYPFKIFGGTIASSFVQPIEYFHYSLGGRVSGNQTGLGDAYSDIFFWTKNVGLMGATPGPIPLAYGLSVGVGMAMVVPDGHYDKNQPITISGNTWVPDPNVALTYNTGRRFSLGDNTQITTRAYLGLPQETYHTHYQSGKVLDIDWSTTQQFGRFRIGMAGYYQTQLTADHPANGLVLPDGNRYTEFGVGPVAEMFLPKSGMFLKAKYQYTFYRKSFLDQQFLVLSAGIKF